MTAPLHKPDLSRPITESGQQSQLSYSQGGFINENLSVTETRSVQIEEKPFFEADQLKQLPDYVAVIIASTGTTVLPTTIGFTRPRWVFEKYGKKERPCGMTGLRN